MQIIDLNHPFKMVKWNKKSLNNFSNKLNLSTLDIECETNLEISWLNIVLVVPAALVK